MTTGSSRRLLLGPRSLPCGVDVDDLLEQVAEGDAGRRNDHQQGCVYCQAALTELDDAWMPVRKAIAETPHTPAAVVEAVMQRVHALVQDVWYTLELTDDGAIRIAARIVARVARDAARRVPGVRVALGRSTQSKLARMVENATFGHRHPHAAVGVLGRTASIDLAIAVTYGEIVDEVAREVQSVVIRELRNSIGLNSVLVNVTVDDVLDV